MPYFIYYVDINPSNNVKTLEYIDTINNYKEARAIAREKRSELSKASGRECRMIFAKNDIEAEKLLSAPREERVIGED
tara:strand:- start:445 stop:678 length:234 start_codon:yes stop_codon:yes gene_type:complete